jgi:hypothetical protein
MSRLTTFSKSTIAITVLIFLPAISFLYVKIEISRTTKVYDRVWSDSGACYIDAYIPSYRKLGILGKTVALFSGNGFYRVYSKEGIELKSSEWLLWQRDYPDMEGAFWSNGHVLYSAAGGYGGWTLPECG